MRHLLLALVVGWGTFAGTFARAQAVVGTLTGRVLDAAQHPVEAATVSLLQARDSVAVRGTLAGADGTFAFSALPAGTYRLVVTAVGTCPTAACRFRWMRNTPSCNYRLFSSGLTR